MTTRRLVVVERLPNSPSDAALRALALALLPHLRALLAAERRDNELADIADIVPISRRTIYRACRAGHIVGATRAGRRWMATRVAIDAWLRASGPRPVADPDDDKDDLEPVLKSLMRPGRR